MCWKQSGNPDYSNGEKQARERLRTENTPAPPQLLPQMCVQQSLYPAVLAVASVEWEHANKKLVKKKTSDSSRAERPLLSQSAVFESGLGSSRTLGLHTHIQTEF
ncbi:hypothetical protein MHYP_G00244910 [Metynnis hypsauchen]